VSAPRIGSINVVVDDLAAATRFLEALGVELEPTPPEWSDWEAHHRTFAAGVTDFDTDLDSASFANWWGGVRPDAAARVVVNLRVDTRDEVDRLHRRALELAAAEFKAPYDAFWGARYAVVLAPGPLCVGFMSPPEPDRRTPPPPIHDFA
jgi:predicted lactoylglutathione lyase